MNEKRNQNKSFASVGSILNDILPKFRPGTTKSMLEVWDIWDQCAGCEVASNARPVAFKGGLLLIHVSNSIWLHQLRFLEKELVEKLNKALADERVKTLKFKIGPV
jgi:predicted nucleic acid-binding Zn ribbon protein